MPDTKTAKTSEKKPSILDELIHAAENAADDLHGETLVRHHLDVAFVHALAGSKDKAEDALKAAQAEIDHYGLEAYDYQKREFGLLKAKVHAALGR